MIITLEYIIHATCLLQTERTDNYYHVQIRESCDTCPTAFPMAQQFITD